METLSRSDEILLISILRLKDNATGVTIIQEVERSSGKQLTVGALWVSLDNLSKRGFLAKRMEDPGPAGGRKKIFYELTPLGARALEATREMQNKLWRGLNPMLEKVR